jgi:hypothetical protein
VRHAARTNAEGVFVAAQRLCGRTDPGYRECAAQYLRGYFDAETGVMLNGKLRPARSGKRINETSFLRIDESVAGASAAE